MIVLLSIHFLDSWPAITPPRNGMGTVLEVRDRIEEGSTEGRCDVCTGKNMKDEESTKAHAQTPHRTT